jgi:hypothetical protein
MNGKFQNEMKMSVTKKPIQNFDAPIYSIPVPNVDNYKVCMGGVVFPDTTDNFEFVSQSITNFWNSEFSYDLGTNCRAFFQNNFNLKDASQADEYQIIHLGFSEWEKKTKENPLFGISKELTYESHASLRGLMNKDDNSNLSVGGIASELRMHINNSLDEIGKEILKVMSQADVTAENRHKVHAEVLQHVLKEIITQSHTSVYDLMKDNLK